MSEIVLIHNILLAIFVLLSFARLFGWLFEKFGYDSVIGELIAGLILGPSVLNWISPHTVEEFAIIGSVLILFLAGLKEHNSFSLFKDFKALSTGLGILIITFVLFVGYLISPLSPAKFSIMAVIFIALAYSVVDLGVPIKILLTKKKMNTPFGQFTLNAGVINVVTGLMLLIVLSLLVDFTWMNVLIKSLQLIGFFMLFVLISAWLSKFSLKIMLETLEELQFSIIFLIVIVMAYFTEFLGISVVVGAFIAGIIVQNMSFVNTKVFDEKLKALAYGIFIPLFFAWFGLELVLSEIIKYFGIAVVFFVISSVVKFVIAYLFARKFKIENPKIIGASMLSLDVESLVILLLANELGLFAGLPFSPISVFAPSVLLTTILVTVLIKIFDKKEVKT